MHNTERNSYIVKITIQNNEKFKKHVFVNVIFVLYHSVFQWPPYAISNHSPRGCANYSLKKGRGNKLQCNLVGFFDLEGNNS